VITIELCVLYSVGLLCGHNVGSHPLIIWVGMVDTKPIGGGVPLVITCSMDQSKTFDKLLVVASIKFSCKQSTNLLKKSEKEEEDIDIDPPPITSLQSCNLLNNSSPSHTKDIRWLCRQALNRSNKKLNVSLSSTHKIHMLIAKMDLSF
jgi:hypothetical protein